MQPKREHSLSIHTNKIKFVQEVSAHQKTLGVWPHHKWALGALPRLPRVVGAYRGTYSLWDPKLAFDARWSIYNPKILP